MNDSYRNEYLPGIVKVGRIVFIISFVLFFTPFFLTWFVLGITPNWEAIMSASATWFFMNLIFWFVEPMSFFPIYGVPGLFIGGIAGNVSNLRLPCAVAAQKAAGVKPGTEQGAIISTIGICVSVFVNVIILCIGVIAGQKILGMLPESVTSSLNYLLPALYGCVMAQAFGDNPKGGIVATILGLLVLIANNAGLLSFMGVDMAAAMNMLVPVFGSIAIMILFEKKAKKAGSEDEGKEA